MGIVMDIIGHLHTDFHDKFGVPRQSGLINELTGFIEFEPKYRQAEAFNGLEEYDYIWVLFQFHKALRSQFSATVKPPRLGGNKQMGVFATRSPFRPNNIGLSSLKLDGISHHEKYGLILNVSGVDIIDNTPVYDIKPYLPYADSHPDARAGFSDLVIDYKITVEDPNNLLDTLPLHAKQAVLKVIEEDPRPGYQDDPDRIYKMAYDKWDIHFTIKDMKAHICNIIDL